jgi:hypothetical protein
MMVMLLQHRSDQLPVLMLAIALMGMTTGVLAPFSQPRLARELVALLFLFAALGLLVAFDATPTQSWLLPAAMLTQVT